MIKNELSMRQMAVIMCVLGAASKLMLWPTSLASACGNALWLPPLVDTAVQTAAVWAVALIGSKTGKTLFELFSQSFTKPVACVIYALLSLFFVFSAVVPMSEQQLMVHEVFYDTIPSIWVFLPFFFFSVYAGSKGLTNAGRTAECCLPLFIVSMLFLLSLAVTECDFNLLLPVLDSPAGDIAKACFGGMHRSINGVYMAVFAGNFRYKRGDAAKISAACATGGIIVSAVCALFYAQYGELALTQYFAVAKLAVFSPVVALVGRLDLIAVYVLDAAILFSIVLNIQAAVYCMYCVTGREWHPLYSLLCNGALFAVTLLFNNSFALVQRAAESYLSVAAAAFTFALPALAWTAYAVAKAGNGRGRTAAAERGGK